MLSLAALKGAAQIYAVGSKPNCIEVAKEFGATAIINYKDDKVEEALLLMKDKPSNLIKPVVLIRRLPK